jgi:polar amino acid transport system permease protein
MLDALKDYLSFLFNFNLLSLYGWRLIGGLRITLEVVTISCSLGFVLAYPLSLARVSKNIVLSNAALAYVTLFRGTPLLCQLYLVYYGAGEIRPFLTSVGLWVVFREAFFCCLFTFALNTAAYQAEIIRGALGSISKYQIEAAAALGLSKFRISRHIVWPQAFLVALRPLGSEIISIIKASALVALVTLLDLMGQTRFIFAQTFDFSIYLYAAIVYLMTTEVIRRIVDTIARRYSRHLIVLSPSIAIK